VVNQTEANPIQPADPSHYILVDDRVGEKVHHGLRGNFQGYKLNFVTIGFKGAVCSPEAFPDSFDQIEPQSFGDFGPK
jgi:hypothetical protein